MTNPGATPRSRGVKGKRQIAVYLNVDDLMAVKLWAVSLDRSASHQAAVVLEQAIPGHWRQMAIETRRARKETP